MGVWPTLRSLKGGIPPRRGLTRVLSAIACYRQFDIKEKPPRQGRRTNGFLCSLHFDPRAVAGDALPFSTGHLYPGVGPALVGIERLPILVRPFGGPFSSRDGRLPVYLDLHIADLVGLPFCRLDMRQRVGFPNHLPVAVGLDVAVRQKRSGRLRITRLSGLR